MIPFDFITEWRKAAPWVEDVQVEQDLIISRALVEIFSSEEVFQSMAFRGGTALFKLFLTPAVRYSEDIDLVQTDAGPIGDCLDAIRRVLDPWLGEPRRRFNDGNAALVYRVQSEGSPAIPIRLKVEINTREHFSILGFKEMEFSVNSRWFTGSSIIRTYELDELLGTKLRALYQRRKGRDLFDMWYASSRVSVDEERIVDCFNGYIERSGLRVSRAEFEANLSGKLSDPRFLFDIAPLIAPDCPWDAEDAARYVMEELMIHIPGEPWKGVNVPESE